jgi:hypothetical protein
MLRRVLRGAAGTRPLWPAPRRALAKAADKKAAAAAEKAEKEAPAASAKGPTPPLPLEQKLEKLNLYYKMRERYFRRKHRDFKHVDIEEAKQVIQDADEEVRGAARRGAARDLRGAHLGRGVARAALLHGARYAAAAARRRERDEDSAGLEQRGAQRAGEGDDVQEGAAREAAPGTAATRPLTTRALPARCSRSSSTWARTRGAVQLQRVA